MKNWGDLYLGEPAVGGLKFSMAQKNLQKVPVGGQARKI